MAHSISSEELGALFEAIEREPTGKLSELAKIAGISLSKDYIGADLSNEDLSEDNLSGANLRNVNLSNTNLSGTNLSGADLSGADLSGADLSNTNLSGADLSGADLSHARIDDATKLDDKWRLVWEIVDQGTEGQYLSGADLLPTAQVNSNTSKKILLLAANPKDTTPMHLDEEVREIDAGLQWTLHREQFVLEQKWAVRLWEIQRAMLDSEPRIVHFSGHGMGNEGLVFEDETGRTRLVDGEALAGLFELFADRVECVVLNGCYSEVQATAIARHINYVIGMNKAIGDRAAIEFAVGFYDALGAERPVEFAYKLGCAAIQLAGIPEHLNPVFKKKPGIGETIAVLREPENQPPSLVRKKRKTTFTASPQGGEIAGRALKRLGFKSIINFAASQGLAKSTVLKFFQYKPIQLDSFKRICKALKLNWREIAGISEQEQYELLERNEDISSDLKGDMRAKT